MPLDNNFRHQEYSPDPPVAPYELISPALPPPLDSEATRQQMAHVGACLQRANVGAIVLVHGTLTGTDSLGWIGELERVLPLAGRPMRRQHKKIVDRLIRDRGNFTQAFADRFGDLIATGLANHIPVRLWNWSSENHHVGRAMAALSLIDDLLSREYPDGKRVLLWGHSHAGNVFALMSNLLGADLISKAAFLDALPRYIHRRSASREDARVWARVEPLLRRGNPLQHIKLDLVTLGTPIRYGWDTGGYGRLLHIVNHRKFENVPEYRARFPDSFDQLRRAAGGEFGDYMQQTFIAGTNLPPNVFHWSARVADRHLNAILDPTGNRRVLWRRWKMGPRVAHEGMTLLVDYTPADPTGSRQLAGHAVYTKLVWLPFHAAEVVKRFYPSDDGIG